MTRREFIAGLGGAAAWPLVARAQQSERIRRMGVLWRLDENDPVAKLLAAAFMEGLAELGWSPGRNLKVEARWNPPTSEQVQMYAKELVDLKPDVLVTGTTRLTRALQEQTRTIPIVIVGAGDPLASGLVASLSHPEGNTTGVTDIFPSITGKWLELLKECVPNLTGVAVIGNPDRLISELRIDDYAAIAAQAGFQHRVEVVKLPVRNISDIESAVTAFAGRPDGGLIVLPPPFSNAERETINRLALQHRLPTTYQDPSLLADGGLLSCGADTLDMLRYAGPSYVDRILRGAKPGDLPVQFPSKFRLVVNLKTAKAIGLTVPEAFLLRADEVIE
jgi:putative tryptophan/tyrosine transport system substrate-binding protein